jgi:hypothetical protein
MYLKGSFESFYKYVVIQFIVKNGNGFIFPHRIFLGKKHFWQKWWELKKKDSKFQILNVKSSVCSCLTWVLLKREAKRRNAKLLKRETVVRNGPKNFRDRFAV